MGIFRFDRSGQIVAFEEKPKRERLDEIGQSIPPGAMFAGHIAGQAVRRVDGRLRLLARRAARGARSRTTPTDFGREIIPAALGRYRVNAHLFRGYWADVGTVASFYDANIMLTQRRRAVQVLRSAPADLHAPAVSARLAPRATAPRATRSSPRAASSIAATIEQSVVGIRTNIQAGATIRRSVLLGADFYEADDDAPARGDAPAARHRPRRRARSRDRRQERADRRRRAAGQRGRRRSTPTATATTSATASSSCRRTA